MPVNSSTSNVRRPPSLAGACIRLALVVVIAYPIVALIGEQVVKKPVWETAGLAAGVCWVSATLALVLFHHFRKAGNPAAAILAGTLVKPAIPLIVGLIAVERSEKLRDDYFLPIVLVFYFVTLVADTLLTLALARGAAQAPRDSDSKEGAQHG
jgi:drug/metabolite transporter (DMT)-like permease